jgi:hypothetical protein
MIGRRRTGHQEAGPGQGGRVSGEGIDRYPRRPQKRIQLASDYEPSHEDRTRVLEGRAFFVSGSALAKVEALCRTIPSEFYFAWAGDRSILATTVIVPDQEASAVGVVVPPEGVLSMAREARRRKVRVLATGHSHFRMPCFLSLTDCSNMARLAAERLGFGGFEETRNESVPLADGREWAGDLCLFDGALRFAGHGERLDVSLRTNAWHSVFSVHGSLGQSHLWPVLTRRTCPACGSVDTSLSFDVDICVVGPVPERLPPEGDEEVRQAASRVRPPAHGLVPACGWPNEPTSRPPAHAQLDSSAASVAPGPYVLWRDGRFVASLSPALLEEAAFHVPALAQLLWEKGDPQ